MKLMKLSFLLVFLGSCSFIGSVSQTSIPRDRSKVVTAKVERDIIFMFNFNNDYIDNLTAKLMDQCPKGSVKGILTKDEDITYFPLVYHKNIVTATGYCVEPRKRGKRRTKRKARR